MSASESHSGSGEDELYNRQFVKVTPSVVQVFKTSYATRYIQKIVQHESKPPRIAAGLVFLFSLVLFVWQILRILDETGPITLYWVFVVLLGVLMLVSSYVAFAMPVRYRLDIVLASEAKPLEVERPTEADMLELHDALKEAMNWHSDDTEVFIQ